MKERVKEAHSHNGERGYLTQKEGLSRLQQFLLPVYETGFDATIDANVYLESLVSGTYTTHPDTERKRNFQLKPFVLDVTTKNTQKDKKSDIYSFYIGKPNKTRNLYLSLSIPEKLRGEVEKVFVEPQQLKVGNTPYFWLDFYQYNEKAEDKKGEFLNACRLLPEGVLSKFDFKHWRGIGEQLLADYVLGENGITFEDVDPFEITVPSEFGLNSYRIASRKELQILSVGKNPQVKQGDVLRLVPMEDEQKLYQWVEVKKVDSLTPEEEWQTIASYRLLPTERSMFSVGWFGAERQLLLDYITAKTSIGFDNLRPIRATITTQGNYIDIIASKQLNDVHLSLYFPKGAFTLGDEVAIIPKQDAQRHYTWLELHTVDQNSGKVADEPITSVKLEGKKLVHAFWNGYEIELLKDVCSGTKTSEDLVPIHLQMKNNPMISLWREGEKKVYFVPSQLFGVKPGDDMLLIPESTEKDSVVFLLKRGDIDLGRYDFSIKAKTFKLVEIIHQNIDGSFDQSRGRYTDVQKQTWMSASRLATEYHLRPNMVYKLLKNLKTREFTFMHKMMLYSEAEARVIIETYIAEKHTSSDSIIDEANDYLRRFLK